jgi:cell division septation protein DedD
MPSRDTQTVILSRQTILLVTAVGVGLLTLCYVLGVQVGKQSAALRHIAARGAGEDLQELPASVADQLTALEGAGGADVGTPKPAQAPAPGPAAGGKPAPPVEVRLPAAPKPDPGDAPKKPESAVRWTLQLVSTPDPAEAQRMAGKAKAAGFATATVAEKGLYKVRLATPGPRDAMDATTLKLKNRGFKPFAIKVE